LFTAPVEELPEELFVGAPLPLDPGLGGRVCAATSTTDATVTMNETNRLETNRCFLTVVILLTPIQIWLVDAPVHSTMMVTLIVLFVSLVSAILFCGSIV
jgi:hypothetical protein